MRRFFIGAPLLVLFSFASFLSAASLQLHFQVVKPPLTQTLTLDDYQIKEGSGLHLMIHLPPKEAMALQDLTAKNIGQTLLLKQGDRVLASPTIRDRIEGQEFRLSFKTAEELQSFRSKLR